MVALLLYFFVSDGIEDVVMCIPHRGRQNLLVGLLNYSHEQMFSKVINLCYVFSSSAGLSMRCAQSCMSMQACRHAPCSIRVLDFLLAPAL